MALMSFVLKGGKGSGWFSPPKGTHTGERHRAVGSGKATGKLVKKKPATLKKPPRGVQHATPYYEAKRGQVLPEEVTKASTAAILHRPGEMYVMPGEEAMHHVIMSAEKLPPEEFDTWTRPMIQDGIVYFDFRQSGEVDYHIPKGVQRAERNAVSAAKAMIAAGYSSSMPVKWHADTGVSLKLTLGEMAS